ncbi:uncharacterized protein N7479_007860 [Penicillium vulpinum]|uniref:uncharacterized protein n=1 Tax=Penicillium vulpinum TaxID=29845 RepID=UPI0025484188|nr:uncharacterized protein N7479_007860 [Penicillium vulpinum]KAJ5960710.1 hypothetical protein N7479_007860 [Penicillium vulpinum]
MRLSLRVSAAVALIILSLILVTRSLKTKGESIQDMLHFDTGSFRTSLRPKSRPDPASVRKWRVASDNKPALVYQTTDITVPNLGAIVVGKRKEEDTAWITGELAEWRSVIYTVDDVNAPIHTPKNKGREALPYLQYIVDHYDTLPDLVIFMHAHRDGVITGWHIDTMEYSNVDSVRALQRDFVQQAGFVNLRCQLSPGCPSAIQPFRQPPNGEIPGEAYYAQAWKELFPGKPVPREIAAPCCSQFAVSKTNILLRPHSDYQRMYDWVMNNNLPDEVTSSIMEYSWHIIFGKDPVFCPDLFQCYADVYGEEVIFSY